MSDDTKIPNEIKYEGIIGENLAENKIENYVEEPHNLDKPKKSAAVIFLTILLIVQIIIFLGLYVYEYSRSKPANGFYCSQAFDCTNCEGDACTCSYCEDENCEIKKTINCPNQNQS